MSGNYTGALVGALMAMGGGLTACSAPDAQQDAAAVTDTQGTFQIRRDIFADYPVTLIDRDGHVLLEDYGDDSHADTLDDIESYQRDGQIPEQFYWGQGHDGWHLFLRSSRSFGVMQRHGLEGEGQAIDLRNRTLEALSGGPARLEDLTNLCGFSLVAEDSEERIALFDDHEGLSAQLMESVGTFTVEGAKAEIGHLLERGRQPSAWVVYEHGFALVDESGEPLMKNTFYERISLDRDRRLGLARAAFASAADCSLFVGM